MKNKINISIALVALIVLVANLISLDFFFRIDLSENKNFTLSKATKDILKNLQEPITVKAYYSENLPPDIAAGRKNMKDMLIEYTNISKGMFVYEFINPNVNEQTEAEAQQKRVQPVMINVREKDQMKQQRAYMGLVISMGEREEVIPFLNPQKSIEYEVTKAIKKLVIENKPVVGLLQGHGEPGLQEMQQLYSELNILYEVEPLTLNDTTSIPDRIKSIAIIRPKDTINESQLAQLEGFLNNGGRIFVALNRIDADLQNQYAQPQNNRFEQWLSSKGIVVNPDLVIDIRCGAVQVQQQQAGFSFVTNVNVPFIPVISNFTKHPAAGGLEAVVFPFASSITFNGDSSKSTFKSILLSSEKSDIMSAPLYMDISRQWTEADFTKKNLVLAASIEGKSNSGNIWKMIVIGDGDFVVNGDGERKQQLSPDNINFAVNSIDWLSDDTGLVELRTKGVTSRPLDTIEDGTKTFLKYLNLLLPILLVLGYGFYRFQRNRSLRMQRLEENYA